MTPHHRAARIGIVCAIIWVAARVGMILTGGGVTGYTLTAAEAVVLATCHGCANLDAAHPLFAAVALAAEGQVPGGALPTWTPERCLQYAPLFSKAEADHDVPAALLVSVAIAETGCQPGLQSSAGALGMMQVVPRWHPDFDVTRWDDPAHGVDYGASFLARLGATTGASRDAIRRAIYAYNSGNIRTAEGDRYLRWVGGMWDERDAASSPTFLDWCRAGSGFGLGECNAGANAE